MKRTTPALIGDLVKLLNAAIVECNTAYGGSRSFTAMHLQLAKDHGFTDIAEVGILDAEDSMELPIEGGNRLSVDYVGSRFANYDSFLVLSHFKGHAMAGFGGRKVTLPLAKLSPAKLGMARLKS